MATRTRDETEVILRFGAGLHSRGSEEDINEWECHQGQNFALDLGNYQYRPRAGFDYLGTAPNAGQINGFASLRQADGTVSLLVQADDDVYQFDDTNFTSVGTVDSAMRMRGRLEHNFILDDKVIITDIALADEVHDWDGSTFQQTTFTDETVSGAFGTFRAKYCYVDNERAIFANIHDNGSNFPHLIVGSKRSQFEQISTAQRPSSSLGEDDPWFLVQPDLMAINGLVQAFGKIAFSSEFGTIYQLDGTTAKDFSVSSLHPRAGAQGDEALVYAGQDAYYGRQGRIESLKATDAFGDTITNDLSFPASDSIAAYKEWTAAYNQRLQRAYFHPDGTNEFWVLSQPFLQSELAGGLSAWSKWVSAHSLAMNPTVMMNVLSPSDSLEYVYMGDSSGNIYKLEGTGTSDAGAPITVERKSKLFRMPLDQQAFDFEGWILYRANNAVTVTITLEFAGFNVFNEAITVSLPALTGGTYYSGGAYYGGGSYYGTPFRGKLTRQHIGIPGKGNEFQIKVSVESDEDWTISEIGLRLTGAG